MASKYLAIQSHESAQYPWRPSRTTTLLESTARSASAGEIKPVPERNTTRPSGMANIKAHKSSAGLTIRQSSPAVVVTKMRPPLGSSQEFGTVIHDAATDPLAMKASTQCKRPRNVLRRKQSIIAQHVASKPLVQIIPVPKVHAAQSSEFIPRKSDNDEMLTGLNTKIDTSFKMRDFIQRNPEIRRTAVVIPELDRYGSYFSSPRALEVPYNLSSHDLQPPTPVNSGLSGHSRYSGHSGNSVYSHSQFSASPGPSAYSRDTTPTSMSSQSPGVTVPLRRAQFSLQTSPVNNRPPFSQSITRKNDISSQSHIISPVRDSSRTSSSSTSTIIKDEKGALEKEKRKKRNKLPSTPPSPPPRKSSHRFQVASSEEPKTPSRLSKTPAPTVMSPSSKATTNSRPDSQKAPATRPMRPSRAGTPSIGPQFLNEPVIIQSNLTTLQCSPERRKSASSASNQTNIIPRAPIRGSALTSAQLSSRNDTPSLSSTRNSPVLQPLRTTLSAPPSHVSRSPSPASANSTRSRFGMFVRKPRIDPGVQTADDQKRNARRGPAAGTGHEGYGRYRLRGRSNSSANREGDRGKGDHRGGTSRVLPEHDTFITQRISPVVIAGGGEILSHHSWEYDFVPTQTNRNSLKWRQPSIGSISGESISTDSAGVRATLWPSAMPNNNASHSTLSVVSKKSIASEATGTDASLSGVSVSTRPSTYGHDPLERTQPGHELKLESVTKPNKLVKRSSSPRRWNFFKRSQKGVTPPILTADLVKKSIPHYALMDSSEHEADELIDVEALSRDEEIIDLSTILAGSQESEDEHDILSRTKSSLTIDTKGTDSASKSQIPSLVRTATPHVKEQDMAKEVDKTLVRPSRLAQVGRIPKVVSARPKQTSPKSFSRPFARLSTLQATSEPVAIDRKSIAMGPSPERLLSLTEASDGDVSFPAVQKYSEFERPFLVITPRVNSTTTTSSSSGRLSLGLITAVVPDPSAVLEEDEVWDEYDDLIAPDENKAPSSGTSSQGVPFQYESFETKSFSKAKARAIITDSPLVIEAPLFMDISDQAVKSTSRAQYASSSVYSPDISKQFKDNFPSTPLLSVKMSYSDFVTGNGARDSGNSGTGSKRRKSESSSRLPTRPPSTQSKSSKAESRRATPLEQVVQSPTAQVNLRLGSMTVSKWLTFGRVLFSPARDDILAIDQPSSDHSILVIDGLGNDDWSFYAAEAYPSATFHNLSPRAPQPAMPSSPCMPGAPANHRQVEYPSITAKIPFSADFFTSVVLRFPAACSDTSLRKLISEARRVLKPGGYIEMSILDLEMMSMGPRCRRMLRNVKVRLQVAEPEVGLGSKSDLLLREIGKKHFVAVKSCMVGLPVSSMSLEAKLDADKEKSLGEMMRDESDVGDKGITKMVAKVGRWWWMRCYEDKVLPQHGRGDIYNESIWADEKLLAECEKWGTSFKLLVCYAQKPVLARRRTNSV